jgi:hypothetical protein
MTWCEAIPGLRKRHFVARLIYKNSNIKINISIRRWQNSRNNLCTVHIYAPTCRKLIIQNSKAPYLYTPVKKVPMT